MIKKLWPFAWAFCLSSVCGAEEEVDPGSGESLEPNPGFSLEGSGLFENSVLLDIDGDLLPDFAFVRGGQVHVVLAVGHAPLQYKAPNLSDCNDLAVLPASETDGPGATVHESLVVATDHGVEQVWWDESVVELDSQLLYSSPENGWISNQHIRVREAIDGPQIVTSLAGNKTVGLLASSSGVWTPVSEFESNTGGIEDLEVFDRGLDGWPEIAVMGGNSLEVWDSSGAAAPWTIQNVWSSGQGSQGVGIAPGKQGTSNWLAWVFATSNGSQRIRVVTPTSITSSVPAYSNSITALTSGDLNGDGEGDLFVGWNESRKVAIYQNRRLFLDDVNPIFSGAVTSDWNLDCLADHHRLLAAASPNADVPSPGTIAQPAVGDIDHDGDNDIVFPVEGEDALFRGINNCIDEIVMYPSLFDLPEHTATSTPMIDVIDDGAGASLYIRVRTNGAPAAANGLEFRVYRRTVVTTPGAVAPDFTNRLANVTNIYTFAPNSLNGPFGATLKLYDDQGGRVPYVLSANGPVLNDMYFWTVRFVVQDGSPAANLVQVFPAEIAGVQAVCDWNLPVCTEGGAPQNLFVNWGGAPSNEFSVNQDSGNDTDIVGNGFGLPCLPDLNGPPRRGNRVFVNP